MDSLNSLRNLKQKIISSLTPVELGCINTYAVENYLISQFTTLLTGTCDDTEYIDSFNPVTILEQIRNDPHFWIEESEIHMKLINKYNNHSYWTNDNYLMCQENANKYIEPTNKSLYSIYNYIHLNNLSKNDDNDYDKIHNENKNECIVDLRDTDDECSLMVEKQKKKNDKLIEKLMDLDDVNTCSSLYNFDLIRNVYYFTINNLERNQSKIKLTQIHKQQLQNFIIYFTFLLTTKKSKSPNNQSNNDCSININALLKSKKKYQLRSNTKTNNNPYIKDQEEINEQVKLFENIEKIKSLQQSPLIRSFMNQFHLRYITPYELSNNSKQKQFPLYLLFITENSIENNSISIQDLVSLSTNIPIIIKAYTILNNLLLLSKYFILNINNTVLPMETYEIEEQLINSVISLQKIMFINHNVPEIQLLCKYYLNNKDKQNNECDTKTINDINNAIRNRMNNKKDYVDSVCDNYLNNYYNREDIKALRMYHEENAGLNWTKDDIEKFKEGFEKYNKSHLPNNKITQFMGGHICQTHVKAMRLKLLKKQSKEKKNQKMKKLKCILNKRRRIWKKIDKDKTVSSDE
jgi:hypothetical protein